MVASLDSHPIPLAEVERALSDPQPRSVLWAIGGLETLGSKDVLDQPTGHNHENQDRIDWLFDNGEYDLPLSERPECHKDGTTYRSVYGRMKPSDPAPTITTGFMSPGPGAFYTSDRAAHPHRPRGRRHPRISIRLSLRDGPEEPAYSFPARQMDRRRGADAPRLRRRAVRSGARGGLPDQTVMDLRNRTLPPPPSASSEAVRRRMTNTPQRDTPFEMRVRRILHARGFRYRVDRADARCDPLPPGCRFPHRADSRLLGRLLLALVPHPRHHARRRPGVVGRQAPGEHRARPPPRRGTGGSRLAGCEILGARGSPTTSSKRSQPSSPAPPDGVIAVYPGRIS